MAANTIRPAGWSGELQDLQDETIRLLHTIRAGSGSRQQQQQQPRQALRGDEKLGTKGREATTPEGGSTFRTSNHGDRNTDSIGNGASRRRRRRRRARKNVDASRGQATLGHETAGPRRFSYTLDTSGWPGGGGNGSGMGSSAVPTAEMGMGKTTVEILDRGEETPRSPPVSGHPSGDVSSSSFAPSRLSQAAALATAGEDESRFRSLTFKDEEGRVRDGFDTYVPGSGGLGEGLQKLRDERDRLAGIEEAQRDICRGTKRREFLRFARRKWLASDLAAESVQRVFRGHIGRRRAALNAEVQRLTGEARAEWVEVRDHNRGEAWYFNPLTGKSQWERPDSLQGTITPAEKVRTLPALGTPSPSKKRPLPKSLDAVEGEYGRHSYSGGVSKHLASPQQSLQSTAGLSPTKPFAGTSRSDLAGNSTASALPPLMKGSRLSVLSNAVAAPGMTGDLVPEGGSETVMGVDGKRRWRDRQEAWVERERQGGAEPEEDTEQAFPFLAEDEMALPDDRFEETGLGLARRTEQEPGSESSEGSNDDANGARGFFLADGTPNIRLRRTIAKALRVTKFDSVSTLLADYTGRKIDAAAATSTAAQSGDLLASPSSPPSNTRRRAATAAPAGGCTTIRTSKKRGRNNNNASSTVGDNPNPETGGDSSGATTVAARLDRNAPYPTGKIVEDKNPTLFASSASGGGRKMVSLMVGDGKKGGATRRRAKTAGVSTKSRTRAQQGGDRGSSLQGLAIRDLTPPGFLPPANVAAGAAARPTGAAAGAAGGDREAAPFAGDTKKGDNMGDGGAAVQGSIATKGGIGEGQAGGRSDTGPEATEQTEVPKVKEICFNCWSKGSGKTCTLHSGGAVGRGAAGSGAGQEKAGGQTQTRVAESSLMCKNWDVGVMRRRYRSEELQEVFAKEASSLRYDKERKKFVSTVEQRHPIYRLLAKIIKGYNFTVRRRLHQKNWMRGFVEQLRMGKVVGIEAHEANRTAKLLRLRNTLQNASQVKAFTATAIDSQPRAPITGTTLAERLGLVKVILDRPSAVMGRLTRVVLDGPTPVPQALYEARRYPLPAAKTMPMPEPKYLEHDDGADYTEILRGTQPEEGEPGRTGGPTGSLAAWIPLMCQAAAEDIVRSAVTNVEVMSPVPGSDEIGRTKHPPALTIKFATFSRKPTPAMMAVGGLPAEMVVHMLVSTRMSPQYGNFTIMQKSSVAPTFSPERSAEYESLDLLVENQAFLPRALQHPLNNRRAPAVTVKTLMADPGNRHYFGLNRPEQTGEAESHGFRTSAHADAAPALPTLDPTAFTPSEEVVTPNLCSANRTVTTHADRSYPFCEPSNRSNTTLDFYHLLLTATCSPNKEQVFTNLGAQECGEFMRGSDPMRPMGHCIGIVYRSWAFLQRQILEEFETDDGISYWFDRRTGETFWERPLCAEEKVPVKEGGTILGGQGEPPDSSSGAFEEIKPRYDQQQMRKLMMKSYEGTEALERRRKQVSTGVKWARNSGALPPPDLNDLEPPAPDPADDDLLEPEGNESSSSPSREESSKPVTSPPSRATSNQQGNNQGSHSPRRSPSPSPSRGRSRTGGAGRGRGDNGSVGGDSGSKADRLAASISQALKDAGLTEARSVKPSDMLRFGMGLGITLGSNGLLAELGGGEGGDGNGGGRSRGWQGEKIEMTGGAEASLAPPVVKISPNGHPIGHGHPDPIAEKEESDVLDHKGEAEHLSSIVRDSADLKTSEEFKGLLVVPPPEPSPCPDEDYGVTRPEDKEADPRRKLELSIPVIAYPETLWKKQYRGHGAAGEGQSWQPAGGDRAANQRAKSSLGAPMRRTNETLPEGFLNAISHTHVGKQHCDYLPHVPNMPQARAVGRVKPRSAAEDWFAVGFDPWSAGREPLSAEFIPTLSIKQEDLGGGESGGASIVPQTGYLELKDSAGHAEMAIISAEEAKLAADFEQITSWARHARYADVETAMNQADWTMPIDYQNDLGVTLLHVAAQNGNKRIAKLCLRKGADVNKRNNNGQTPLHYAYSYGFESFGEYLISKGADDSIVNADGLTCYEGLNQDNLGQL